MKFGDLIDTAIDMIQKYNPIVQTIDSHADEYLDKVSAFESLVVKSL